ncbi:MAG: hypothetical protein JW753_02075 [Dehalococcoidia bacterium]|nr:hypothetical protein [Dehalococcoidia bacterium]
MRESTLQDLASHNRMVMIERKHIDDHALHGYLLAVSSHLILLRNVYDFQLDGYTVLGRRDVTRLVRRDVERFHERIESEESIAGDMAMPHSVDITDWRSALSSLQRAGCNISLEREPELTYVYLVGKILKVNPSSVIMLGFDPLAKWHDASTRIPYSNITRICFDNRYISTLSRYTH